MGWREDKRWSDRFIPEIKSILGSNLIMESNDYEDKIHNTDLIILRLNAIRIGCRIRRPFWFNKYNHQFTIRFDRPSGKKTELEKILEGWGDYFFYGFSDEKEEKLCYWIIGDLNVFRVWYKNELCINQELPGKLGVNRDGSSCFRSFNQSKIPGFILNKSEADLDMSDTFLYKKVIECEPPIDLGFLYPKRKAVET